MYKRHFKKVMCCSFLFISLLAFSLEVFAATSMYYVFSGDDGMTISVESDSKISGHIYLQAARKEYTRYYNGKFRFVLYKKNIFGKYAEVGRKMKDTYNDLNITTSWENQKSAYYKGTLQLYSKDTTGQYSGIPSTFSISYITPIKAPVDNIN